MEGCRGGKNFCEFEQDLVLKQNIYLTLLMGENRLHDARFFPPKDLVYFFSHTGHNSKRQTFFPKKIFPPRDLVFSFLILRIGPFKSAEYLINHYF